ncbi:MAG TPA: hypothetical protein VLZ07_07080 [Syntrophales bacterium]|nr:hypothetical protein [Syntrophales bacterium]
MSHAADYQQVTGLMDLRTTFSDGAYDIEGLVLLAKQSGFSAVFINDHDRVAMEYGLPPFRNLFKKKVELSSINYWGADKFIEAINDARQKHPDMIVVPGSETTAFYYWTGSPLQGNLTAHDYEKRLLTVGMEDPKDYENLPILDNNNFSMNYFYKALPGIILFSLSLLVSLVLIRWKGILRITGVIVFLMSVGFLLNSNPFRSSPFDPYHGDQKTAPYQLLIDYVNSKGGMTFWNYPETSSGVRKLGPIRVSTLPYPDVLTESTGYTGFAALYGDNITITEPGNIWDTALKEYVAGYRARPPWGIATSDFHEEGEGNDKLGTFQTVFLVEQKSKDGVLKALKNGKMYACAVKPPEALRLDEFSVSSSDERKGFSGDEITLKEYPHIKIAVSTSVPSPAAVKIRLIRSGEMIYLFEEKLPLVIDYVDPYYKPGEKIYYRMDLHGSGTIVSNPVFVRFE